jgi:uncharacterized membrane protein
MFEGLDWRSAARRSAIVIGVYLALFYILSRVAPRTFGLDSRAEVISLLGNAVVFFFVFTLVYAFIERNRKRRTAELQKQQGRGSRASGTARESGAEGGALKGRPNPNTSRKKSRRRR